MSKQKRETEFLRKCIRYDESARRRELEATITQIQRDQQCVRSGTWLMGVLLLLAVIALGYAGLFVDNFPYHPSQRLFHILIALGAGSLISMLAFECLGVAYRRRLNQRCDECRSLVAGLLERRLGQSAVIPGAQRHGDDGIREAVQAPVPDHGCLQHGGVISAGTGVHPPALASSNVKV
jgi:hypothetical protein